MCSAESAPIRPSPGRVARALATLLIGLSVAGCAPTLDVSSGGAFNESFAAIKTQLDPGEREKLRNAILYLAANGDYGSAHLAQVGGVGKSVKATLFTSTDILGTIVAELGFQEIGGRTAAQVIDAAQSQSMKYFHRPPLSVEDQLTEFRDAVRRDTEAAIAELAREIVPEEARFKSQGTLLASAIRTGPASYVVSPGQVVLEFDVDNIGPMTVRAVQFEAAFPAQESGEPPRQQFQPLHLERDLAPGEARRLRVVAPRDDANAAEPNPASASDVTVTITNALVSDGAWIVTVDTGKLDRNRQAVADLRAAESRALDNLEAMDVLLR